MLTWVIGLYFGHSSAFSLSRPEVVQLPQIHNFSLDKDGAEGASADAGLRQAILASQFEIARDLTQNAGSTVFVEGLLRDFGPDDLERPTFKRLAWTFPKGLPPAIDELNPYQRTALMEGGAFVAFALGTVKALRRTAEFHDAGENDLFIQAIWKNTPAAERENLMKANAEFRYRVTTIREIWAVEQISLYLESPEYVGERLALVFGAAHRFRDLGKLPFRLKERAVRVRKRSSCAGNLKK